MQFLGTPDWRDTQRVMVGGGLRQSRLGEAAIARADARLKQSGQHVDLRPVRRHPDAAALVGVAELLGRRTWPPATTVLAVDIGGSCMRVGLVALRLEVAADFSATDVVSFDLWCHADDTPDRDPAVARLVAMLQRLVDRAADHDLTLAPVVGIGCPGVIDANGHVDRGGQNLPGDWHDPNFNLPDRLLAAMPMIAGRPTEVVMHNDAVVQGLSEAPFMRDVERWGVLTIGTGLGNARFTNRALP